MTEFSDCGTTFVDFKELLITNKEIEVLKKLALKLPREHISIGDTGDLQNLFVARVMTDVKEPTVVNQELSNHILRIIESDKVTRFVEKQTGYDGKLKVRRSGFNYMPEGSTVGLHDDIRTNPNYLFFVSLPICTDYNGGAFYTFHKETKEKLIYPKQDKLCISSCSIKHGVEKVLSGTRAALVWFYADVNTPRLNQRDYTHDPLPKKSAAAKGFDGLLDPQDIL
jgi:hypothetical protein